MAKLKNNSTPKYRGSLQFRTWLYFVSMTVTMLAILWLVEVLFYATYYRTMKVREFSRVTESIAQSYRGTPDPTFDALVENAVLQNQLTLAMFTLKHDTPSTATNRDINLILYKGQMSWNKDEQGTTPTPATFTLDKDFFSTVKPDGTMYSYTVDNANGNRYYSTNIFCTTRQYGHNIVYFYTSSIIPRIDISTNVFSTQLIVISVVCIIVSVLLSLAFSRSITKPLTQFVQTAKRMGNGKKVVFKKCGYAEFDELGDTLTSASAEIERTDKLRKDFLANVSHDLRTPLTMVKAYAEMIRDISYKNDAKRTEHIKIIIDEVERLTLLVNDLLDLSKLQSGTRQPELKIIDLSLIAKRIVKRFDILTNNGYNFNVICDNDAFVLCDERMVEQIFYNLIGNAISYTGEDKKVTVSVKIDDATVTARISDTGKGIAPSEKDKVWDRYYRINQTKRNVVGSGIGLSIVKSIFTALNAEYGIASVVNNGSTFWFSFPLEKPAQD